MLRVIRLLSNSPCASACCSFSCFCCFQKTTVKYADALEIALVRRFVLRRILVLWYSTGTWGMDVHKVSKGVRRSLFELGEWHEKSFFLAGRIIGV